MLSSALRLRQGPINKKKAREKCVEVEAPKQAPAPVESTIGAKQPTNVKAAALATAAVCTHLAVLGEVSDQLILGAVTRWVFGGSYPLEAGLTAVSVGLLLPILALGWRFFKRQQRVPMLLNGLAWLVLLTHFPIFARSSWPFVVAALGLLAGAFALSKPNSNEPETPVD